MDKIRRIIGYFSAAMCISVAVMTVLDGYNPMMGFLTGSVSKLFIYLQTVCGLIFAVWTLTVSDADDDD